MEIKEPIFVYDYTTSWVWYLLTWNYELFWYSLWSLPVLHGIGQHLHYWILPLKTRCECGCIPMFIRIPLECLTNLWVHWSWAHKAPKHSSNTLGKLEIYMQTPGSTHNSHEPKNKIFNKIKLFFHTLQWWILS